MWRQSQKRLLFTDFGTLRVSFRISTDSQDVLSVHSQQDINDEDDHSVRSLHSDRT